MCIRDSIYAILLIAMMLFNNSSFKVRLLEKRAMRQMEKADVYKRQHHAYTISNRAPSTTQPTLHLVKLLSFLMTHR